MRTTELFAELLVIGAGAAGLVVALFPPMLPILSPPAWLIANSGELPEDGELNPEVFVGKMYDVELRSVEEDGAVPYTVVAKILSRRL